MIYPGPLLRRTTARRSLLVVWALCLLGASCSSGSQGPTSTTTDPAQAQGSQSDSTNPPNILGLSPDIDLAVDDCWAELPPLPETTTTTVDPDLETSVTAPPTSATVPAPLADIASTLPMPTIIANVDCAGSSEGRVFATFCLGTNPEAATDDPTEPALVSMVCDPDAEVPWPGDRVVRRTAVRLCLAEFEQLFGETYAESDLVAKEFAPTEGIWNRGLRGVVCWIDTNT